MRKQYSEIASDWQEIDGINVTLDDDVTVEDLSTCLKGQDYIIVACHGNYQYNEPIICLREKVSVDNLIKYYFDLKEQKYSEDIKSGNIILANTEGGEYYWIKPSFFTEHYNQNDMKDAIIYIGNCYSFGSTNKPSNDLADTFRNCGASTVMGYYNSVYVSYAGNMMLTITDSLLDGKTIQEAIKDGKSENGIDDRAWFLEKVYLGELDASSAEDEVASIDIVGNKTSTFNKSELQNGSFEEAQNIPVRWNTYGDVRVIQKLGGLFPQDGNNMGIITTGIGSSEGASTSTISQTFFVPQGIKQLSFKYDVISEEPMEFVGTSFNDYFEAMLIDSDGNTIVTMAKEEVNSSTWYGVEGIDFEGGDDTVFHTGWKTVTDDTIQNYQGQYVTLVFKVADRGDSSFDTATLLDAVAIS